MISYFILFLKFLILIKNILFKEIHVELDRKKTLPGATGRFIGTPPSFSAIFSNGDNFCNFLFAYLEDEVFPKWVYY